MAFLTNAYAKLMSGKLVRSINFELMGISSRLRRKTREISDVTNVFTRQERSMKQALQAQCQAISMGGFLGVNTMPLSMMGPGAMDAQNLFSVYGSLDKDSLAAISLAQQTAQMQYQQSLTLWQNQFEQEKEMVLSQLKDEEEDLQIQKENLESRLKLAEAEYKAYSDREDKEAQSVAPKQA